MFLEILELWVVERQKSLRSTGILPTRLFQVAGESMHVRFLGFRFLCRRRLYQKGPRCVLILVLNSTSVASRDFVVAPAKRNSVRLSGALLSEGRNVHGVAMMAAAEDFPRIS